MWNFITFCALKQCAHTKREGGLESSPNLKLMLESSAKDVRFTVRLYAGMDYFTCCHRKDRLSVR